MRRVSNVRAGRGIERPSLDGVPPSVLPDAQGSLSGSIAGASEYLMLIDTINKQEAQNV